MSFDADALLAALPRRAIRLRDAELVRPSRRPLPPSSSALGQKSEYNGFSIQERNRVARLSNWLCAAGGIDRPETCDICSAPADDEHAENYYDVASWIGLCRRCHRTLLHGRFDKPANWTLHLDRHEVPSGHWARLVAMQPFDLAALLRSRGFREPAKTDFLRSAGAGNAKIS